MHVWPFFPYLLATYGDGFAAIVGFGLSKLGQPIGLAGHRVQLHCLPS